MSRDVARAVADACVAQTAWARRPARDRIAVLRRAVVDMEGRRDEIAGWIRRESGGAREASCEVTDAIEECHHAIALARMRASRSLPLGVISIVNPFAAPFYSAIRCMAAGLATGSAVLLKPDRGTPVSGGTLIAELMERAGLPPDLLHVLSGDAATSAAMIADPAIAAVFCLGRPVR